MSGELGAGPAETAPAAPQWAAAAPPPWQAHGTLSVADIPGAQPAKLIRPARRTPEPAPDPGMQPRRYTRERNSGHSVPTLSSADIPGAQAGTHSDWLRPRARPLNPLAPNYSWPTAPLEAPAPPPKFLRDTLDVTDIPGTRAEPVTRAPRGLPSTMRADDIEGTAPGWRPRTLFAGQPRDPLRLSDIEGTKAVSLQERQRQPAGSRSAAGTAGLGRGISVPELASPPPPHAIALPMSARGGWVLPQGHQAVPEYGVAYTPDWHKQRAESKMREGEAARQARQAAEAAIAAAASKAAASATATCSSLTVPAGTASAVAPAGSRSGGAEVGAGGLGGMVKSLRVADREKSGRVQASEFASALNRSGLGLSQGEVASLVAGMRDPRDGSVEYRPFVSKLWGKLQAGTAGSLSSSEAGTVPVVPAGSNSGGQLGHGSGSGSPAVQHSGGAVPAVPAYMPQYVAARQRRLQTNVGLALSQQPEALAAEAAEVAQLPGFMPWKVPAHPAFGKRMAYEHPTEFGGVGAGSYCFAGGDPRAAEAALQWKASHSTQLAATWRRENQPSKQQQQGGGGSSLPSTPPDGRQIRAVRSRQQAGERAGAATPAIASTMLRRENGSTPLAEERAARVAAREEVALLRSLQ